MIELTPTAHAKIQSALASKSPPLRHLRIRATIEGAAFEYHLEAIEKTGVSEEDTLLDNGDFTLVIAPQTEERIRGSTIDFRETLIASGFHFDNPNEPESPSLPTGERTDLSGPIPDRVRMLLDTEINPTIAAHGGVVRLVEVKDNRAYVAFGGGCHGCGLVDVTLKQGIETRIREAIPEIVEVVDTTDHEAGANPFYA